MTTIIMRNAFFLKNNPLPPDVSCLVDGKPVTWAEVIEKRRIRQRQILRNKRRSSEWRLVRVTVWYNAAWLYGGWHAYIEGVSFARRWVRNEADEAMLMSLFPLADNFRDWKPAFAERYQRGTCGGKPRGSVFCWALFSAFGSICELRLEAPTKKREQPQTNLLSTTITEKEKHPMAQTRVQIAYNFQIDPAQQVPGLVRIPEQIIRTVSIGTEIVTTEKVSPDCLSPADRADLIAAIEKETAEATRTAKPAGASAAADATSASGPAPAEEEESAF